MIPSKPKSSLSETLKNNKSAPATPKTGKMGRSGSTKTDSSPLPKSRSSPRSVESKPKADLRSPRFSTTALNTQLDEVQEDLKRTKEQLAFVEKEKARVLEELSSTKKMADEVNEKLKEALVAQRKAEESSEIEKFRADELEQANIEASQKRENERETELQIQTIVEKHQLELENLKHELEATINAKITALSHAEDAMKIAEFNAEKVEILNSEINHLKSLMDSKLESVSTDKEQIIKKLESKVETLNNDLERAKVTEEKLVNLEHIIETLNSDLENTKDEKAESDKLVDESKKKSVVLEVQLMETTQSANLFLKQLEESKVLLHNTETEKCTLEEKLEALETDLKSSLESESLLSKQLEEVNASLLGAESEAEHLRGKTEALEIEIAELKTQVFEFSKQADELKEKSEFLDIQLSEANKLKESISKSLASVTKQLEERSSSLQDALSNNKELEKKMEELEIELTRYKEDLMSTERCLDISKQEASEMTKEIEMLKSELEILSKEKERALISEESLLEEKNKLIKELDMVKEEEDKAKKAMEGLTSALHEISNENRETQERIFAKEAEYEDAVAEIERSRSNLKNTEESYEGLLKELREEIVSLKTAVEKLENEGKESQIEWEVKEANFMNAIKKSEEELAVLKSMEGEKKEMESELREAKSKLSITTEAIEAGKADTLRLREKLLDKENELQSISQENFELRTRETVSLKKIDELTALLKASSKENAEQNGEYLHSEKEKELLPEPMETQVQNVEVKTAVNEEENLKEDNGSIKDDEDLSIEMENKGESIDGDSHSKTDSDSFEHTNGLQSGTKDDQTVAQKKKKPLLHKFGSMLKKKSPHKS